MSFFDQNSDLDEYTDFGDHNSDTPSHTHQHHKFISDASNASAAAASASANEQFPFTFTFNGDIDWTADESLHASAVLPNNKNPLGPDSGIFLTNTSSPADSPPSDIYNGPSNDLWRISRANVAASNIQRHPVSNYLPNGCPAGQELVGANPVSTGPLFDSNATTQGADATPSDNSWTTATNNVRWSPYPHFGNSFNAYSDASLGDNGHRPQILLGPPTPWPPSATWAQPDSDDFRMLTNRPTYQFDSGATTVFSKRPHEFAITPFLPLHRALPSPSSARMRSLASALNSGADASSLGLVHVCRSCRRYFDSIEDLNRHNCDHTLPNACIHKGCDAQFDTIAQLKRHKAEKHTRRPFRCPRPECPRTKGGTGLGFSRVDNLNKHIKDVHDNRKVKRALEHKSPLTEDRLKTEKLSVSSNEEEGEKTLEVDEFANKRQRIG